MELDATRTPHGDCNGQRIEDFGDIVRDATRTPHGDCN